MPETALCTDASSTQGLTPGDSRERWRQIVTTYQCTMTCDFPDGAGTSDLQRLRTDRNQVLAWQSPRVRYRRDARHMRQDGIDAYIFFVPTSGTAEIDIEASRTSLRPGHGALVATNQPFDVTHTPYASLRAITIERRTFQQGLPQVCGPVAPINLQTGLGGIVHDLLNSAVRTGSQLSAHEFDAVLDRLVQLVCVLVGTEMLDAGDHFSEIEGAIRRYVRDNAHEPDLNSELIATALGWSVRQIQLALQRSGTTCRDLIKNERLSLAHDRLSSPGYHRMPITELAYHCGFSSPARFSTAFKERFGLTPRELRDA
ncbi:AraC family transcriptional regulator [Tamaricihabitans halophyticus]|uniref:AraC family transcriptional regulator n=1 Tax=Tamaricihabitans halophyticus TaxID=1262583 RepID=A0A4R2QSW1_9PSEU|nr:AraC family transcriptional regulator [Tamaricihabitans halophyticus]